MKRTSVLRRRDHWGPRGSRGLAAVEFAITAPVLIFVMLAAAEVGRAFVHYDTLSYSIRNSARFVTEHAINGTTGVIDVSAPVIGQARNLAVYGNVAGPGGGEAILRDFLTSHVTVVDAGNDNIRVTAAYPYRPMLGTILPTFGFGSGSIPLGFTMRVAVTMRAIS
jgi:Flp pilus assembly protein TadG